MDETWKAPCDAETLHPSFEEKNGSKITWREIFAFGVIFENIICNRA